MFIYSYLHEPLLITQISDILNIFIHFVYQLQKKGKKHECNSVLGACR